MPHFKKLWQKQTLYKNINTSWLIQYQTKYSEMIRSNRWKAISFHSIPSSPPPVVSNLSVLESQLQGSANWSLTGSFLRTLSSP